MHHAQQDMLLLTAHVARNVDHGISNSIINAIVSAVNGPKQFVSNY